MANFNELADELARELDRLRAERPELFYEFPGAFFRLIEETYNRLEELGVPIGTAAAQFCAVAAPLRELGDSISLNVYIDEESARRFAFYGILFPEWLDEALGKVSPLYSAYEFAVGYLVAWWPERWLPQLERND